MEKAAFLDYLSSEFSCYYHIPLADSQRKIEKRQYLNGLMKAARFFGVTHDELKAVIDKESEKHNAGSTTSLNDLLDEPAYLRSGKEIQFTNKD